MANVLDRLIGYFSPARARGRLRERELLEAASDPASVAVRKAWLDRLRGRPTPEAKYDAAKTDRLDAHGWLIQQLSPTSEQEQDLELTRDRSRDLFQGDGYAHGSLLSETRNTVGVNGFRPQPKIDPDLADQDTLDEWTKILKRAWRYWSHDAGTDRESFNALVRLAVLCWKRDGDVFLVASDRERPGKQIPLQYEVISAQRCETPIEKFNDPKVRLGVETEADGETVAYWFRVEEPHDTLQTTCRHERVPRYFPDGTPRVIHLFERWYPGQKRGLPFLMAAIKKLKSIKNTEEAREMLQHIAACFAVFVQTVTDGDELAEGSGTGTDRRTGKRVTDLYPGMIHYLGLDESVHVTQPPSPGQDVTQYLEQKLRSVAATTGQSYEQIGKDWLRASFAGGRLALLDGRLTTGCGQQVAMEQMLDPMWARFVHECVLYQIVPIPRGVYLKLPAAVRELKWIASAFEWPDRLADVKADAHEVEAGFATAAEKIESRGGDPDEVNAENERDFIRRKEAGLPTSMPGLNRDQPDQTADNNQRE